MDHLRSDIRRVKTMYSCENCKTSFTRKDSMKRHGTTLAGCKEGESLKEKPKRIKRECTACRKNFSCYYSLWRHKKTCKARRVQLRKKIEELVLGDGKRMEDELFKQLHDNHKKYLERLKIGEKIAAVVEGGKICKESLSKEHKDMLDLYQRRPVALGYSLIEKLIEKNIELV